MIKKLIVLSFAALLLISCADAKEFTINNKTVNVQPYGWMDQSQMNDSINYKVNVGNVVWSVILSETVIVPIVLTGNSLWEPISKK